MRYQTCPDNKLICCADLWCICLYILAWYCMRNAESSLNNLLFSCAMVWWLFWSNLNHQYDSDQRLEALKKNCVQQIRPWRQSCIFCISLHELHNFLQVSDWQHICYVLLTCFSTNSQHSCGYQLKNCVPLLAELFLCSCETSETSYSGFSRQAKKRSLPDPLILLFSI